MLINSGYTIEWIRHQLLFQVRAFLHNEIGLNELFRGDRRVFTHQYALLDLNPILP